MSGYIEIFDKISVNIICLYEIIYFHIGMNLDDFKEYKFYDIYRFPIL